ncbi:MAG TPA: AarF/ABC1/UbiB kinase family protein [Pyrinomonadaceae bacterium]|jgi:predicted unusual protein kinase regulating ubiquinone biosynthesis (AarF/ABC1/UbiB family)
MAATERGELTEAGGAGGGARLALAEPGAGKRPAAVAGSSAASAAPAGADAASASAEGFEARAKSWRGFWRMCQIVRVLGTMSLYLFLNDYDIRAAFNARAWARRLEEAKARGRLEHLRARARELVFHRALDRAARLVRRVVYRGAEGSEAKRRQLERQGVWLKENLIGLGPTFIKIGQALGTRADLLPLAYIKELALLQDQVPPFPNEEAFARVESELGRPLAEAYAEFDPEPVASASLGQVYRARLHTGEEVAVKVQRPRLRETVGFDVAVLGRITRRLSRYPAFTENADWEGMLREFRETISEEMDYAREGRNADRFRANFREWRPVRVPRIHWTHTTARVITMEFVRGTKVTDLEGLKARRISPVKVNRLLVRAYLKQLLEDGFFHADPHPGNLLVMDTGHLAFFDFGMVGRITPDLQSKMIDSFFHVVGRDIEGLAQDLINLNFLKPGVDAERVRPVVEGLFRHYLNLKLGDVNFKELTYDLAEVMYEYPFRLPSNFTYIIRALMTLEGIGLVTDPGFSFFETARPYAKEFMLKREGKQFRRLLLDKITGRDEGRINWGKMWKLAKLAARTYLEDGKRPEPKGKPQS